MNDEKPNMPRSSRADETAEDIFARIQRRRALAMNGNNTERGALRHERTSSEAHPAAVAGESLADILRRAAHENDKCVIVVTHSKQLAKQADVVLKLKDKKLKA